MKKNKTKILELKCFDENKAKYTVEEYMRIFKIKRKYNGRLLIDSNFIFLCDALLQHVQDN